MDLRSLYQEVILDHGRRPRNFGALEEANRAAHGDNPLCGDRIAIYVILNDGKVEDVAFTGRGCAISMASASLMTEAVKGKSVAEAHAMFERFHHLVTSDAAPVDDETLEKLNVFAGVRDYPVRVKCATLPWHTLNAAIEGRKDKVTTE